MDLCDMQRSDIFSASIDIVHVVDTSRRFSAFLVAAGLSRNRVR
jgi:hypothetical protein